MSYYRQQEVASYVNFVGIKVIVREGLNNKSDWELRLEIPKYLHELYDGRSENLRYTVKDGNMYFAVDERTGRVSYFFYDQPGRGFGGSKYKITMVDGSVKELIGPWSSNSRAMNAVGHEPSKEVNIDGKYNMADAMTVKEINRLLLPLEMEVVLIDSDPWIIRL